MDSHVVQGAAVATVGIAEALDNVKSLPNPEKLKLDTDAKITTRTTSEIVSNSDRSNGPNGSGGGSTGNSSTSDATADHEIAPGTLVRMVAIESMEVPEIVLTSNEVLNDTSVTEASQKRASSVKRSPNRYSRMKKEISNTYYPSKSKQSNSDTPRATNARKGSSSLVPMNGQPCVIHKPTLDELQSMTFTEFVRTKVIPAATALTTENSEESDDDDDDDENHITTAPLTTSTTTTTTTTRRSVTTSTHHSNPTRRNGTSTTTTTTRGKRPCDNHNATLLLSSSSEPIVLREGIAKIRLPPGFFTTAPYGHDTTGRGPIWAPGTSLGDKVFHNPILQNIRGMTGVYEYTHTELPATTLATFRDRADKYRLHQLGSVSLEFKKEEEDACPKNESAENDQSTSNEIDTSESTNAVDDAKKEDELTPEQVSQLERQFWKRLSPTMPPPVYGADEPGTLFEDDNASGWSLAKLDSCLHVLSDIPGVTSPYLYAGMWASVFCAHTEDMNLLSINYLHAGQPKIWYAVAEQDAARFVSLAEHHFVHQLQKCKEFLRHKRCLLSPLILQQAGIRYQTAIQYPGDAIITFPGGYHFGFNAGFNIAEATNFGVLEWLPFGRRAKICLCRPDSVRIDMNRLIHLLQRYQVDLKRNKRLTWKEWRKRYERKMGITTESKSEIVETEDEVIEIISYAPKKRQRKTKVDTALSEQERKNEFWIEVTLPSQLRKTNSSAKKGLKHSKNAHVKPWYLAKPIGRKRLEVNMKILCLVPATPATDPSIKDIVASSDVEDEGTFPDDNHVEELCFTGTIIRIEDRHALLHFDGQSKTSDIWMPLSSSKIFLNGGIWNEEKDDITKVVTHHSTDPTVTTNASLGTATDGIVKTVTTGTNAKALPVLHYWKEMDTNVLSL